MIYVNYKSNSHKENITPFLIFRVYTLHQYVMMSCLLNSPPSIPYPQTNLMVKHDEHLTDDWLILQKKF